MACGGEKRSRQPPRNPLKKQPCVEQPPSLGLLSCRTQNQGLDQRLHNLGDAYPDFHNYGTVTWLHGNHTFMMGADFGIKWLSTTRNEPAGIGFSFGPNFTQGSNPIAANGSGYGLASFLAGTGGGSSGSGGPDQIVESKYYGGFFQDDWRVMPKLTLNMGIRYDFQQPWIERHNRFTDWTSTAVSPLQVLGLPTLHGGLEFPGTNGLPRTEFNPSRKEFQPRFGFAYSVTHRTVLRGGYGIYFGPLNGAGFNGAIPNSGFASSTPWVSTLDGVTPLDTLSNPFPDGFNYPTGSSLGLGTLLGQGVTGMDRHRSVLYSEEYNFDIQHRFLGNLLFSIAYAGSHGVHLYGNYNANQLPDKYLSMGTALLKQVANPFYGSITKGSLSGPTVSQEQLLCPFPQFTGVTLGNSSFWGASDYNSMQIKVVKRYSDGFNISAAYTWSKLMDNLPASVTGFPGGAFPGTGIQDYYNLPAEWAVASFDTPQYLAINGIYQLPFGRGHRFFSHSRIANYLIGGWQLNGITTAASGNPLEVTTATNTLFNSGGTQRANWNGQDPAKHGPVKDRLHDYFNLNAFSAPAPFTYGNSPRMFSALRSPASFDTDLSGIKFVPIRGRVRAEIRAEAFNLFNHPIFGPPNTAIGTPGAGTVGNQVNLPRQLQLAVKLLW